MRFYHVWFSTKGRQHLLEGDVRHAVLGWFKSIADEIGVRIDTMEVIQDHAHLLVGLEDRHSLPVVMQRLKGRSSREVMLRFPDLRDEGSESPFWQKSYGSHLVAKNELPTIRDYIQNQEEHHGVV